ncbi:MAG: helix-turn-helix transcriptional regulator [Bacteroidales bacterium]|nr:helix-turn-helix transcriptional regulator [Candidatus Colicola faecequi]
MFPQIENSLYFASLVVLGVVCLFTGIGLVVGCLNIGNHKLDANYVRSRHWMATAMGLLLVCVFIHYHYHLREFDNTVGTAVTLAFYYAISRFFGLALITICNPAYATNARIYTDILKSLALVGVLGLSYHYGSPVLFHVLVVVAALVFFADTAVMAMYFLRYYRNLRLNFSNYYAESYEAYINWMPLATFFAALIGFSAPLFPFMSKLLIAGFNAVAALVFLYVFMCYERFIVFAGFHGHSSTQSSVISDVSNDADGSKQETGTLLPTAVIEKLEQWIAEKGYCRQDINIRDLARMLSTNRTYLSGYINSNYHQSFRTWITTLRIEEAKRQLKESDINIEALSSDLGYCSISAFLRAFQGVTGLTPDDYRKRG